MSAVLTCSGVDAGYVPGRPVLRDVNITLDKAGTVLALLGPNGAGKTTLLLTIAGLQAAAGRATSGSAASRCDPARPAPRSRPAWCWCPTTARCSRA